MVIPSGGILVASAVFTQRRAAEFRGPLHHGAVEQAALFQVADECGDGLVNNAGIIFEFFVQSTVMIPGCVDDVDEPDTTLNHASGEQAVACEILMGVAEFAATATAGIFSVHAVVFQCGGIFLGQINEFGRRCLHAACQFIAGNTAGDFRVFYLFETSFVYSVQSFQACMLKFGR